MKELTSSLEDYIEAVFLIEKKQGFATVSSVANLLKVKKPSAHFALNSLKRRNLLNYQKYGKITLTPLGLKESKNISEVHFKLTELFAEIIGLDRETASSHACLLEHDLKKEDYKKISRFISFLKKEKKFLQKYKEAANGK